MSAFFARACISMYEYGNFGGTTRQYFFAVDNGPTRAEIHPCSARINLNTHRYLPSNYLRFISGSAYFASSAGRLSLISEANYDFSVHRFTTE